MTTFNASTAAEWRAWLAEHAESESEVWLVIRHQDSATPSVRYGEAIEQALCFGWIDSRARKRDADSFELRFSPRRPRSRWSRTNRQRATRMIEAGLMTRHGQAVIDAARRNGDWDEGPG
jgi:uncharacterized protein YdeI (YjbR/CyaY-like superfamily)